MPIVLPDNPYWDWVDEIFDTEGTVYDWGRKRDFVRRHRVKVKIKEMGPIAVALLGSAFPGTLPQPGTIYEAPAQIDGTVYPIEFDTDAIMIHQRAAREKPQDPGAWEFWIVTSEYGTDIPSRQDSPGGDKGDPSQDLADVSWDHEEVQTHELFDLFGTPYMDTAFTPYLRAPTRETNYPVLAISRNELTYNYGTASYYARSLNDEEFLGAPRGCVQALYPKGQQKNIGKFRYWRTSYRLRFRAMHFNRTGSTDPKDRYRLPPIQVMLPRSTGNGSNLKTNSGVAADGLTVLSDQDYLGQCRGDIVARPGNTQIGGAVYYDPVPHVFFSEGERPAGVRIWDSWQPLIQIQGLNRLGKAGVDASERVGKTIPILDPITNHPVHHPLLLDPFGQPIFPVVAAAFPPDPPQPWYQQFIHYRYTSLQTLLVRGLT